MAESGNKGIGKLLQKSVSRTKEKVLQNLGRADKTTDDAIDLHVNNFNEQQATFARLQREVKQYLTSVKDMSIASDNLYRVIRDTYEPTWTGYSNIALNVDQSDLWKLYMDKLNNQLLNPLTTFACHFQDVKAKIAKRNRKLTDYDGARHAVDSLSNKKCDPAKMAKAEEELAEAKKIYDSINNELHTELPEMFNRRIEFLATLFNVLFVADVDFHQESAKLSDKLAAVTEELKLQSCNIKLEDRRSTNSELKPVQRVTPAVSSSTNAYLDTEVNQNVKNTADDGEPEYEEVPSTITSMGQQDRVLHRPASQDIQRPALRTSYVPKPAPRLSLHVTNIEKNDSSGKPKSPKLASPAIRTAETGTPIYEVARDIPSSDTNTGIYGLEKLPEEASADASTPSQTAEPKEEPVYNVPRPVSVAASTTEEKAVSNSTDSVLTSNQEKKPEREILYRVLAIFPYHADDTDELSFEPGEIIAVVHPDESAEQDEGWLMGLKESTSQMGMFPENFTKRL